MLKIMLVQPWNYHDEGIKSHDLSQEWRNGPYSLVLLATQLKTHGHDVMVVDMMRDLVILKGDIARCLTEFAEAIARYKPDIIGFGFFSIHYFEVKRAVEVARQACDKNGIHTLFIAGGIHASIEPHLTIKELGFDYAFVGEADLGILKLANGHKPETISGVVGVTTITNNKGEEVKSLDSLPFPDWSLCDYQFYTFPSWAKAKFRRCRSLDMVMGRGCVYRCTFCAYNALSTARFYSSGYLIKQIEYMKRQFAIDSIYFTDSTIGNNRRLLVEFCELMINKKIAEQIKWYANMRPNQIDESLLKLMWRAGCRILFYGFESGSQRILDLMVKGVSVEVNYKTAELHNKLKFPYHASMLLGYPGETEEDILKTFMFLRKTRPPIIGVNWYVPLPGSPDYNRLKYEGIIKTENPMEWRIIGEVNSCRVYANVPEQTFRKLFTQAEKLAYEEIPKAVYSSWRRSACSQINAKVMVNREHLRLTISTLAHKFMHTVGF